MKSLEDTRLVVCLGIFWLHLARYGNQRRVKAGIGQFAIKWGGGEEKKESRNLEPFGLENLTGFRLQIQKGKTKKCFLH